MARASRSRGRLRIEREIAQVAAGEARLAPAALAVIEREVWPDGTEIVWLASPFPFERKPIVPSRLHRNFRVGLVDLATLIGTQRRVTSKGVEKYSASRDFDAGDPAELPLIYHADSGKNYVADGHHRLAAAYLRGDRRSMARIVEIGALDR